MDFIINWIYIYCTDFIINIANFLGLSYYEVNVGLFCILYPVVLLLLVVLYLVQRLRWYFLLTGKKRLTNNNIIETRPDK